MFATGSRPSAEFNANRQTGLGLVKELEDTMTHELHNLTNLEGISLDDMNARAAMLTRVDRKYVVPTDCLDELLAAQSSPRFQGSVLRGS